MTEVPALSEPRIYISGPITGQEETALERFGAAAVSLEQEGWFPVNPTWIASPNLPYGEYIRLDLLMLLTCEAIYMLQGWELSAGASLERQVAELIGLEVLEESW